MKNKFNFKSIILTLTLLTLGVGQMWAGWKVYYGETTSQVYLHLWNAGSDNTNWNNKKAMTLVPGTTNVWYYEVSQSSSFNCIFCSSQAGDGKLNSNDITVSSNNLKFGSTGTTGTSYTPPTVYSVTVSTESSTKGTISAPASSPASVVKDGSLTITASEKTGYYFTSWTASPAGNATFANSNSKSTTATITGNVTITAHFTNSLQEALIAGSYIMVYGGELSSWNQSSYYFMNTNSTSDKAATASLTITKSINSENHKFGAVTLPPGTYYQGHWASGMSCAVTAGHAYVVRGSGDATYFTQKAKSSSDYLYEVIKQGSTAPTYSVSTTIDSEVPQGSKINISSGDKGVSVLGITNQLKYYLYNGSSWSELSVSDGKGDVTALAIGTGYKIATFLYDGNIYVKADVDEFEVIAADTKHTVTFAVGTGYTSLGSLSARNTTDDVAITSGNEVAAGKAITFTASPNSYYKVEAWYTNAACNTGRHNAGETTYSVASLSSDLNVYVKFEPITYSITYNLNGGTNHVSNPSSYNYTTSTITLQAPTKTGYTFGGWYDNSSFTGSAVTTIPNHSNGNKEYWAKWTINSYNITYSPASAPTGATYTTTPSSANYNSTVDVVVTPTAANYLIQVTAVDAGSNTVTVTNPSANTYRFTMPASNVTVTVTATTLPVVYVLKTKHANSSLGDGATGFPSDGKIWAWKFSGGNNFYTAPGGFPGPSASSKATAITDDIIGDEWYRFIPDNISQFDGSTAYHVKLTSTKRILDTESTFIENGSSHAAATHTGTIWIVPHGTDANTAYLYTSYPDEIATPYNTTYYAGDHGSINVFGTTITSGNSQTISTTKNRTLTATPASGYEFNRWVTSGSVTVADATSATTTVSATGAGGTVTATYFEAVNSGWYIKGNPAGSEWGTPTTLPLNRLLPGETDVYYRPVTLPANDQYFRFWHDETGKPEYGASYGNLVVSKDTKYDISKDDGKGGNAFKYSAGGTLWFVIDESAKKFWLQDPVEFYSVNFGYSNGCKTFSAKDGEDNDLVSGNTYVSGTELTFTQTKKDGYTFVGWNTAADGSGDELGTGSSYSVASLSADVNVYAIYEPKTTNITLSQTGAATTGSVTSRTGTYDAAMPAISGANTLPVAQQGYAFMGYYDALEPLGTQYYNADGTSAHIWDKTDATATLYAYFKKAEITAVELSASILDPVAAGGTGFITANPTIAPRPSGTTKVCWELLYDNNNPVEEHNAISTENGEKPYEVQFSIAGLAAGGYKIKATLRTGDDCSGGTLLSEREVSFTIASGYTVTIQYKDTEGNTIAPSTTSPGKATDWTAVSAPNIFGYTFSTWVLGDGITKHGSDALTKQENFRFSATFNGTLTAQYTKNKYIYLDLSQTFSESGKWDNPWVYFYTSAGYWGNDNKGAGATDAACVAKGAMTQIEGTDIWYYDYSSVPATFGNKLAFTWGDKHNQLNFYDVDAIYRGDFSDGTPLFVPAVGQSVEQKNDNHGHYYNKGYWTNYVGDKTGYTVIIYDNSTNAELKRQRFTSVNNDMRMTMKAALDLDAATTYKIEILRDNGKYYKKNSTLTSTNCTNLDFTEGATKGSITSTAAGSYIFTLGYSDNNSDKNFELRLTVEYPAAAKDFQILYNDDAEWSLGSAHSATWIHPSRIIRARENGVDTISFFVAKDNTPILKARKVNSINASTGAITWGSLNINGDETQSLSVDSSAVYNFKVTQGTTAGTIASIEKIGAYTGNYYIRCNALNSNWDNYTTDGDHRMTYSSFSESNANSFGEKYSHYKAKWCPRNTNIAFCIANDYSPCITDTLKQDVGNPYNNTDTEGTLKNDGDNSHSGSQAYLDRYSANVRFMWNRKTNKISRAYVSASTSENAKFLVLQGSGTTNANIYNGSTGAAFAVDSPGTNSVKLSDNENWIYEVTVKANPSALVKLYANYCGQTQWFRGAAGGFTEGTTAIQILGGSASASQYSVRVIYDFKTNRLIAAWVPSGSSETIDTDLTVNADVMIVREHQESAQCITFSNDAKMTSVKNVYGVMRFNRWILNNRQHPEDQDKDHARADRIAEDLSNYHAPLSVGQQKSTYERRLYFISFPFDVLVGDIFGFGTYGQYWVIQYYDGLNRAKKGYWMDSKPNWKYVSPTQVAQGYKLEKNQGYILELNLSAMAADNTTFWSNGISTIELYFPSTVNQEILKQTNCTIPALSDEYECKINRGTEEGDRRVKDSYWRCIGVPSYNLYNSTLKDGSGNDITWKTDYTWYNDEREFPFIYMWNKTDNTLTPQATSTFTFQPMHAYLTQIKNAIVWTAVSAKPSSIVARRASKEATKEYNWRIELKQDTTFLDQTYVRMTDLEQVTDSFDFGQDLIKELNSRSNIYTFIGYEKVAANSMTLHTDQTTVIPVGANITTEGEYTFALPDGADGIGVTLIDAETGTHTNLSAGMDYTVYLEKGTHDNRFWLEISPVQQTPTDIELINGENGDASLNGVRKVLIDGILYIVKDGKLFDATGKRVE